MIDIPNFGYRYTLVHISMQFQVKSFKSLANFCGYLELPGLEPVNTVVG